MVAGLLVTKNVKSFCPAFGEGDVQIQPWRCSCRRKRVACSQQLARMLLEPSAELIDQRTFHDGAHFR